MQEGSFISNYPGEEEFLLAVPVEEREPHVLEVHSQCVSLTSFVLIVFCDHHQINSYGQEEDIYSLA